MCDAALKRVSSGQVCDGGGRARVGVWGGQSKDGPDTGHFASETAVGLRGSGLLVAGLCRASRRRAELSTRPLCGGSLSRGVGGEGSKLPADGQEP